MADDGIRERHGMRCTTQSNGYQQIIVREADDGLVCIDAYHYERQMTMREARYLASKLYRLARRIRDRESVEA